MVKTSLGVVCFLLLVLIHVLSRELPDRFGRHLEYPPSPDVARTAMLDVTQLKPGLRVCHPHAKQPFGIIAEVDTAHEFQGGTAPAVCVEFRGGTRVWIRWEQMQRMQVELPPE